MADYRDYGAIQGQSASQVPVMIDTRTQVYKATHDEAGIVGYIAYEITGAYRRALW